MNRLILAVSVFALLAFPARASAQTVILSPAVQAFAEFVPSSDHNATDLSGVPKVTNYQLDAVAMNSIGAMAFTANLGKPTPNAQNLIVVIVPGLTATITPDMLYTATVTAIGPGGTGVSAPSNPFGVASGTSAPPAAVTNLRIKRAT